MSSLHAVDGRCHMGPQILTVSSLYNASQWKKSLNVVGPSSHPGTLEWDMRTTNDPSHHHTLEKRLSEFVRFTCFKFFVQENISFKLQGFCVGFIAVIAFGLLRMHSWHVPCRKNLVR